MIDPEPAALTHLQLGVETSVEPGVWIDISILKTDKRTKVDFTEETFRENLNGALLCVATGSVHDLGHIAQVDRATRICMNRDPRTALGAPCDPRQPAQINMATDPLGTQGPSLVDRRCGMRVVSHVGK